MKHETVEKNVGLLAILIVIAISFGGLVEITPLIFQKETTEPVQGLKPYTALQMEGRDIYIREGCNVCHSQMIRPFRAESERYGHYSVAGESVWEHPFLWGSVITSYSIHYTKLYDKDKSRNPFKGGGTGGKGQALQAKKRI